MIAVRAALVGAFASRPAYEIDWSGLSVDRSVEAHAPDCSSVPETHVLRGALVTYSRKGGLSTWGHSAMRFQVCTGGRFRDVEFEAFRLSPNEQRILLEEETGLDAGHLKSQQGALVWFANEPVVDRGFYHQMQARNRDVLELSAHIPRPAPVFRWTRRLRGAEKVLEGVLKTARPVGLPETVAVPPRRVRAVGSRVVGQLR